MSWSKALPPVTIKERGFALSDLLQPAGLEQQHIIAGRAWVAARDLYRAHARLARLEGDHLELLLRKRWYGRCGFASFRDFVREELQRAPRTAKRRVALSRLARESPELAAALDEGRLSPCQALALSRLRDAPDLVSWIRIAEDCTVRELEDLVADYVSALSCEAGDSPEPEADDSRPQVHVCCAGVRIGGLGSRNGYGPTRARLGSPGLSMHRGRSRGDRGSFACPRPPEGSRKASCGHASR